MSDLNRRELLAGTALAGAAAATGAVADRAAAQEGAGDPDLSGRSILVTGTSSGFGHLGALHYARLGARVIATMRDMPRPEADALRQAAEADGLDLHLVPLDVLDESSVREGIAEGERIAGGALDVLVNNAGIGISGPVELQDEVAAAQIFGTNVDGYLRTARAALPAMRAAGRGLIVNSSSQLGRVIYPNIGLYSATKFAVEGLSEQMAYELAPHGVDVAIVQPGGYPTEIWENGDRYTRALLDRIGEERKAGYPELIDNALRSSGGGSTDPMDVPRAIAELIAMPAGERPLRRPVHPGTKPQLRINEVSRRTQLAMLENSPFGPAAKSVLGPA
ncbi:short-chain dehydrogenase/reductase [Pacificimonas flava]|uniref:Short-chain dehydrogenase/reductase n=2 Tax=Pacificimonas TaxID=1960290 RepID=A0A219B259_9SPHN|nr:MULTISPECIES: SDR family NAD(P)-dependent oxidoreductase [Pacificimonas]MBZ6378075.1 SDR family NAD(P)-dependent oxidoreductase [Pacificimonas aurantium]OWV32284.1 short-chain dehydrogenase/reductase [Pacificimonas flava]